MKDTPQDALAQARAVIQADKERRKAEFVAALQALQQTHRVELLASPGQTQIMPDGTIVITPPSVGFRALD